MTLKSANGNFDAVMSLSSASKLDLHWWVSSLPTACRVINCGLPTCVITTDVSGIGWGASMDEVTTQGLWSLKECRLHINVLELLAIQFSLLALLPSVHDQHVRVESDNTAVISHVNSMGGYHSVDCYTIAKKKHLNLGASQESMAFRSLYPGEQLTQVWFTGMLNLLIELPQIFHMTNDVLSNPLLPGPHPLHPKLYLMACKLSGVIPLTTAFHHKLQILSCPPGNQVHKSNTTCTFTNSPTFVLKGKLIPCLPLTDILCFLHTSYQQDLSYSALNTADLRYQHFQCITLVTVIPV